MTALSIISQFRHRSNGPLWQTDAGGPFCLSGENYDKADVANEPLQLQMLMEPMGVVL